MSQINQYLDDLSGANWKMFGETEFPLGTSDIDLVHDWLVDTLRPLNLNGRVLEKILTSAHFAMEQNIQFPAGENADHVHLIIFTPKNIPSGGQSWGFFRVQKRGDPPAENETLDHAIVFYLYLERK